MSLCKHTIVTMALLFSVLTIYARKGDRYELQYTTEAPAQIAVKAVIIMEDSLLYMSPYGGMPEAYPKYVRNLRVKASDGRVLPVVFTDSLHWVVEGVKAGESVALHYTLQVDHEKESWPGGTDGVAYARPYGVMTSGRSLFVMNGKRKENIEVSALIPETWHLSSAWKSLPGAVNTYLVKSHTQLQEAFLFAGTHKEVLIQRDDFTLQFVLGGAKLLDQEQRITGLANDLLDYYIGMMGGIPRPATGKQLDRAMVIITGSNNTDGEVIGNHISMFMNPEGSMQEQLIGWFIFAHEFFHLWNGKTLRFEGSRSDWFKEGISNYYTLKSLYQVGFINEQALTGALNALFYQRYINDPGLGEMSPVASAEGFSKDKHWGLIYGGGLFAGIAMDMEIRKASNNQKSLDHMMRELYGSYGGTEKQIDNEVLKSLTESYGFTDFSLFYQNYLEGKQAISLAPYLKYAGVKVMEEGGNLILQQQEEKTAREQSVWEGFLGKI